jgi:hypothetical protein
VTICWALLYYNFRGVQVCSTASFAFEIISPSDVTHPQFNHVISRLADNTFEQAPVFLSALWLYTLFVDYGSVGPLGGLYLVSRLLYAPLYLIPAKLTVAVEFATQPM